jgi:hypothetical protein
MNGPDFIAESCVDLLIAARACVARRREVSEEVVDEAADIMDGIVGRIQGNRHGLSGLTWGDLSLLLESTCRACLEILSDAEERRANS